MALLSRHAVQAFLNRPRDDWAIYKRLPDRRLDALARRYQISPALWAKLKRHQKIMMLIGLREPRFAFFADTGTGKTRTVLALAEYFADPALGASGIKRTLVLVPRRTNKDEWLDEIAKHAPQLTRCALPSNIKQKWWAVEEGDERIVVETYSGLLTMVCRTVPSRHGKSRFVPDKKLVKQLCDTFDGLVLDESQAVKTKGKLPYRIARKLAQSAKMVFALSATPHGRNVEDLWAQLHLLDGGATLGETLGLFRAVFCREKTNLWGFTSYEFMRSKEKLLHEILANRSIRFPADQAELPQLVKIEKRISLPDEAQAYYERAKQTMLAGRNIREIKGGFLRMRQISSGFVGFMDEDTGQRAEVEFADQPKLDMLMSVVESIDPRYKIIIFHEFVWSGLRIMKELEREQVKAVHLYGGTTKVQAVRQQFNTDPATRVLVLQNSFGQGLNLQAARYGIFFESPVSPDVRYQCVRRFERQHSQHGTVFSYDLITRGTYDELIQTYLRQGKDLLASILDGEHRAEHEERPDRKSLRPSNRIISAS